VVETLDNGYALVVPKLILLIVARVKNIETGEMLNDRIMPR
jgi:hypothetical protein